MKKDKLSINRDLLSFFDKLNIAVSKNKKSEGGYSANELREMTGVGIEKIRRLLKEGIKGGFVTRSSKYEEALDGRSVPIVTYIIDKPKKI